MLRRLCRQELGLIEGHVSESRYDIVKIRVQAHYSHESYLLCVGNSPKSVWLLERVVLQYHRRRILLQGTAINFELATNFLASRTF